MNKHIISALQNIVEHCPEKIFKFILDNAIGIEIVERGVPDYDSDRGNLYFQLDGKYYKIPFINYSYGEAEYKFKELEEVQPKTKIVTYFE